MAFCEDRRDVGWGRNAPSLKPPKETRFPSLDTQMSRASMTIRGGGDPNPRMALRPTCRMGPPLRSSAADAHYCIMVQIPRIYRIQVCGAMLRAQLASAPQIVPNTETQHHTREQSELPRL